jgi:hypothetical protein
MNIRYGNAKCFLQKLEFSTLIRTSNGLRAYQPNQQTSTLVLGTNIRKQYSKISTKCLQKNTTRKQPIKMQTTALTLTFIVATTLAWLTKGAVSRLQWLRHAYWLAQWHIRVLDPLWQYSHITGLIKLLPNSQPSRDQLFLHFRNFYFFRPILLVQWHTKATTHSFHIHRLLDHTYHSTLVNADSWETVVTQPINPTQADFP